MKELNKPQDQQRQSPQTEKEKLYQILASFLGATAASNDPRVHQGAAQKGLTELRKLRGRVPRQS